VHLFHSRLPEIAAVFEGGSVRLRRDASIRALNENGAATYAAFRGEENVSFPFHLNASEKRFSELVLARERFNADQVDYVLSFLRLAVDGILSVRLSSRWLTGSEVAQYALERLDLGGLQERYAILIAGRLLRARGVDDLAHFLYTSGRWPMDSLSLQAARRVVSLAEVIALPAPWYRVTGGRSEWVAWRRGGALSVNPLRRARAKLYVSVCPAFLEPHFEVIMETVFSTSEAVEAKIASTARGLHRPDALVVYCESFEQLSVIAQRLVPLVATALPSSMTFAPRFAVSQNIFWGIDPIQPENLVYGESWRRSICCRCAQVAIRLRHLNAADPITVSSSALVRLNLDGVDTATWIPPYAPEQY
jgi:hypothetical protein